MNKSVLKQLCIASLTAVLMGPLSGVMAQSGIERSPQSSDAEPTYMVNFKDSDIRQVIKFVADTTGKTMVIDPRVKGRITVLSSEPQNERELYALFRSVLEVSDFTVVEVGDVVRIVPLKDARTSPLAVGSGKTSGDDSEFVTHVIQLKNIAAAKVLPVLRPLIPQHSHFAAYDPSNAIVISDTLANIQRVRDVIEKIDKAALPVTEIVQLKFADADEMVSTLSKLEGAESKGSSSSNKLVMVADKRNNAIIMSGEDIKRTKARELIKQLDRPQQQSGNVRVVYLEYADAKGVAEVLSKVVQNMAKVTPGGSSKGGAKAGGATVEADEATNALLITASGEILNSLLLVVERLDVRRAQVLVEAIIVEIEDGDGQELGIEWLFQNTDQGVIGSSVNNGNIGGVAAGVFNTEENALQSLAGALGSIPGQALGVAGDIAGEEFLGLLTMLDRSNRANILSTPTLLTTDNHEATISVGQNVPFVTGSFTNSNGGGGSNPFQTIQRQDVGITLTVTPQINKGDQILMEISQEISSLTQGASSASDIITNQRKVETQVLSKDGAIVVLGGLIQEDVQQTERRVPLLGDIPLLGRLFRSKTSSLRKSNLMIFIKGTIVRDDDTLAGATAEKYRLIREQQIFQRELGIFRMDDEVIPVLPELSVDDLNIPAEAFEGTGIAVDGGDKKADEE